MHVTKYTRGTLGHMLGHYDRTKDGLGENVVPERTQLNRIEHICSIAD